MRFQLLFALTCTLVAKQIRCQFQEIRPNISQLPDIDKLAQAIMQLGEPKISRSTINQVQRKLRQVDLTRAVAQARVDAFENEIKHKRFFDEGLDRTDITGPTALLAAFRKTKPEARSIGQQGEFFSLTTQELVQGLGNQRVIQKPSCRGRAIACQGRNKIGILPGLAQFSESDLRALSSVSLSKSFADTTREAFTRLVLPSIETQPEAALKVAVAEVSTQIERAAGLRRGELKGIVSGRILPQIKERLPETSTLPVSPAVTERLGGLRRLKRQALPRNFPDPCPSKPPSCKKNAPYRNIDGSCNNLKFPLRGRAFIPMRRLNPPMYDSASTSSPRAHDINGNLLPNPRDISLKVHDSSSNSDASKRYTHLLMQWGQFLDHDHTSTAANKGYRGSNILCCVEEHPRFSKMTSQQRAAFQKRLDARPQCFNIKLKTNDPDFAPRKCMSFVRSLHAPNQKCSLGYTEQLNQITAYLDGSNVYGSSKKENDALRSKVDGKLKESTPGNLPHSKGHSSECLVTKPSEPCFMAGDERVNEQSSLTSVHTLWLREHNRVAGELKKQTPGLNDEILFQETRKIVIAEMQHITYKEYLPIIVGQVMYTQFGLFPLPAGYNPQYRDTLDASITNVFATAAYRFGHSLINDIMHQYTAAHTKATSGVPLRESFFNPSHMYHNGGANNFIRGLINSASQKCDRLVSPEISKHLFEEPNKSGTGFDLISLNIQRGRDHGLPGYIQWRTHLTNTLGSVFPACRLRAASSFNDLPDHDQTTRNKLASAYGHIEDMDLFSAGVSEKPISGAVTGPTFACLISVQFFLAKYGDRFFYEFDKQYVKFAPAQLDEIRKVTMSRVICDNTNTLTIQPRAFENINQGANARVTCTNKAAIPSVNMRKFKMCTDGGWSAFGKFGPCALGRKYRYRFCNNPKPSPCGKPCNGVSFESKKDPSCLAPGWFFGRR